MRLCLHSLCRTGFAVAAFICLTGAFAPAGRAEIVVELAPHRAVYDLSLVKATERSGISAISARLVYELKGSSCDGYTLNIRLVSNFTTNSGKTNIADTRISSFEGENSSSYQYSSQQYLNQIETQKYKGFAKKGKQDIIAVQEEPGGKKAVLPEKTQFPNEHTRAMVKAALMGESLVQTAYFDGSDGINPLRVSAIIGKHKVPGSVTFKNDVAAQARLKVLSSWPVIMSYFDTSKPNIGEQTPIYETSMHLFENGVASAVALKYADFSIAGHLAELTFFPPGKCD